METRYFITGDSAESIEDAKKVTVAQALNEQNKRITRATEAAENVEQTAAAAAALAENAEQTAAAAAALAASKQDVLIAGDNITISPENVISASVGSSDIVIYDNENGVFSIEDIALDIGAIYEMYITSAVRNGPQYGQQKIVIRLIPREITPSNYSLYVPVHYIDVNSKDIISTYIKIYNSGTELWDITYGIESAYLKIYKIVKKMN